MKKKKSFKKGFITISIILGVLFVGNISFKLGIFNLFKNSVVEAVNVVDTLEIMKDNNPINVLINSEIKSIEEEKAKILLDRERKDAVIRAEMEKQLAFEQALNEREAENERKRNGKIAYLTFDDGPSLIVTPRILDTLDEYNIKATFFVVGNMVDKHPQILQMIYEKGHTIGNHSYSHNYGYLYKNTTNFITDINKAFDAIKNVLGEEFYSNMIRFPGGSFGKNSNFAKAAIDAGYKYYDWNALNGDAEGNRLTKDRLVKRLKETTKNQKKLIVLMHDTDAKETTADALKDIIDYLIDKGYEFDTLDNYIQ